jgi:hypothetical protein
MGLSLDKVFGMDSSRFQYWGMLAVVVAEKAENVLGPRSDAKFRLGQNATVLDRSVRLRNIRAVQRMCIGMILPVLRINN